MINRRGSVLLLTFIFMVALTIIVTTFVGMITVNTRQVGAQRSNAQAFYLAEAGVQQAIWYLKNTAPDSSTDGSWRTTAYPAAAGAGSTDPQEASFGSGTYTLWVQDSGSNVLVTGRGEVSGLQRVVQRTIEINSGSCVPEAFTYVNYAGGDIDLSDSRGTAQIDGDIGAQGSIDNDDNVPVSGDIDENETIDVPTVDYSEYENIADHVVNGDKTFAMNSTSSGIWYVKGDVEIEQNAIINGSIIAEGKISFTGNNATVTASNPYPALIAQEKIKSNSHNNITIYGVVYSEKDFEFDDSNNFTFTGSLIVGGDIKLSSANNFDITFESSNPPFFETGACGSSGSLMIIPVANSWGEI